MSNTSNTLEKTIRTLLRLIIYAGVGWFIVETVKTAVEKTQLGKPLTEVEKVVAVSILSLIPEKEKKEEPLLPEEDVKKLQKWLKEHKKHKKQLPSGRIKP